MFKKTLAAALVLGALSFGASAANVTVYGAVDTGFTYTHNGAASLDKFEMSSGNYAGSRFGFKGTEDLGNGTKVGFILENGFSMKQKLARGLRGAQEVFPQPVQAEDADFHLIR